MLLYLNTCQESKQIETCMRQNDCWQNIFHIGDNFLKKKNFPTWKKLSSSTLNALWSIAFYFNTKVNSSAIFTTPNRICQTPYLWAPGIKPYWLWKGGFQCNQLNVNHWKKDLKLNRVTERRYPRLSMIFDVFYLLFEPYFHF